MAKLTAEEIVAQHVHRDECKTAERIEAVGYDGKVIVIHDNTGEEDV